MAQAPPKAADVDPPLEGRLDEAESVAEEADADVWRGSRRRRRPPPQPPAEPDVPVEPVEASSRIPGSEKTCIFSFVWFGCLWLPTGKRSRTGGPGVRTAAAEAAAVDRPDGAGRRDRVRFRLRSADAVLRRPDEPARRPPRRRRAVGLFGLQRRLPAAGRRTARRNVRADAARRRPLTRPLRRPAHLEI